jgi:UDP-N-acetylmuramoylalanine--D-glutamate ligase
VSRFADPEFAGLPGKNDRVTVLGLGLSGEAAARHLLRLGAAVTVVDAADDAVLRERAAGLTDARVLLGRTGAGSSLAAESDLVVPSPGVPDAAPALVAVRKAGVPIWSEVELAFRIAKAPIVGVSGTNGKTTTTRMIAGALSAAGYRAAAAGNIGRPLTDAAVEDHDVIVAELSSFQLRHVVRFHSPVAVLLNVADDHLDWHGSFESYVASKARLFERQTAGDTAVYLADETCAGAAAGSPGRHVPFVAGPPPTRGAGIEDGWIVVPEGRVLEAASMRATGLPAIANAIAAAAAACAFGADPERAGAALASFEPLPHRMELVATSGGVAFVDDSKATNPHAVLAALEGLERVVLIAGGRNKGLDLGTLAGGAASLRAVVAIGESAPDIVRAFRDAGVNVERAASMDEAVARAWALAASGDTVLLSPGCASFDMFSDYAARGEAFRAAVKRLTEHGGGKR